MELSRNLDILFGLCATKKCAPVLGEISDTGLGAMVDKVIKDNEGVNINPQVFEHNEDDEQYLLHGLRPELQKIITDITEGLQAPFQMVFGFMLGGAATALGYKISSRWKSFKPVHPNLNIVVVGVSGAGKSTTLDAIFEPIKKREGEYKKQHRKELREWKELNKEGKASEDKPTKKKLTTSGGTMEALQRDIVRNPNGMALLQDEGVLDFLGNYKDKAGQERDDNNFIKICNCDAIDEPRKGDDEDTMSSDHSYLCVVGGTQPVNLDRLFGERRILRGVMARFLFLYPPLKHKVETLEDAPIDMSAWNDAVDMMLGLPATFLHYSDDAKQLILQYRQEANDKGEVADAFSSTLYGKLGVHVLRLSMVLHYLSPFYKSDVISADEMRYTIKVMKYFEKEWLKVLDELRNSKHKNKLGFYQAVHQDWDTLKENCEKQGKPLPCSQAEFAKVHGITPQNFSQKVMSTSY